MERLGKILMNKRARFILKHFLLNNNLRSLAILYASRQMARGFNRPDRYTPPEAVSRDKRDMVVAMLKSIDRGLTRSLISKSYWLKFFDSFLCMFVAGHERVIAFREKYKMEPPGFLTISPTRLCNLNCEGCYAISSAAFKEKLSYEIFTRIIREQKELWGSHFTVISGGEPFAYKDSGKDLLDIFAEHQDSFFQVFTNGTLITRETAQRLSELANATPAISVEGFEAETDARRGRGVFKRVLTAMENLREAQVPFGISVTSTRKNIELLLSDAFWDFFFDDQGALYCWLFQYMPIGRSFTLDLMITSEQRIKSYEMTWRQIREKKRFIADFWNCGTVSNGCISAGVRGGYMHIDWNGAVTPCVFNPYFTHNIKDVYESGGTLTDVLFSSLFEGIRRWQRDYVYERPPWDMGNVIATCPYRDHYDFMRELLKATGALPENEAAEEALKDEEYMRGLIEYGQEYQRLTDEIWRLKYLEGVEFNRSDSSKKPYANSFSHLPTSAIANSLRFLRSKFFS